MSTSITASIDILERYSSIVKRLYAATGGQLSVLEHFHDTGGRARGTEESVVLLRLLGQSYDEGLAGLADRMAVDLREGANHAPPPSSLIRVQPKEAPGLAQNVRRTMRLQVTELVRTLEPLYTHMEATSRWSTTHAPGHYPTLDGTQFAAFSTLTRHTEKQFLPELEGIIGDLMGMKKELSSFTRHI